MKKVAIIMGSSSDLGVVRKAAEVLDSFSVPYEVHVYSAHRTPEEAKQFAQSARDNGFGAIIAAAGKAAHLAGAIAANTTLPVIGIPVKSSTLDGIDALLWPLMGQPMPLCCLWRFWRWRTPRWRRSSARSGLRIPPRFSRTMPLWRRNSGAD